MQAGRLTKTPEIMTAAFTDTKVIKEITVQGTRLRSHIKKQEDWNNGVDALLDAPPMFEIEGVSPQVADHIKKWIFDNCKRSGVKSLHISYYDK